MIFYFSRLFDDMRKCRNWQTSKTKDLVAAMSCGFKSHLPHYFLRKSLDFQGFFCIILCFSILLKFLQSLFYYSILYYILLHQLSAQIFYDLSGNDQSCHRRHKCHTARYIPTLRTLMLCSRWADTVRSAADRHIFYRSCRLFLGIDHL